MLTELLIAFGIVAVCVIIHITSLVALAEGLIARKAEYEQRAGMVQHTLVLILVFGVIIILHLTETAIWAAFYQGWSLFPDFETSLYFSLTSYTTIGFGDVVLPQKWRLLGGIEGFSGLLLCGLSGAFLFVILGSVLRMRRSQLGEESRQPLEMGASSR